MRVKWKRVLCNADLKKEKISVQKAVTQGKLLVSFPGQLPIPTSPATFLSPSGAAGQAALTRRVTPGLFDGGKRLSQVGGS